MKVLLGCGGRDFRPEIGDLREVVEVLRPYGFTHVRHGDARGADRWFDIVAAELGCEVQRYPADWERFGKRAGFLRNAAMLAVDPKPVLVCALPGGRGTQDTIRRAKRAGIQVIRPLGRI